MGLPALREKIAFKLKEENSINCTANNIIITAGAKQAFQLICMALLRPGDEAIIINPSFVSFIPQILIAESSCKINIVNVRKSDFKLSFDDIERTISAKTKILVINSPNNPAGYVLDKSSLVNLYSLAEEKDFYIISDEVYEKFIFSNKNHFSIGSLENEPQRVITINGFSKSYAMTGWRLGYACFPKELTSKLLVLQQHINTNTCTFIQQAVIQSIGCDSTYLEEYKNRLAKRILLIENAIANLDSVKLVSPEAGFFAFINISGTSFTSNSFCCKLIEEMGVATTPGIAFGDGWDDHVRISFATSEEFLTNGMSLIVSFLKNISK
jgi:aspartate/methionine/tyrosine aminotransferase